MTETWIDWFLSQPRGKFFVKIDDHFLSDAFNWYGIKQKVHHFQAAFELLHKNYVFPSHAKMEHESEKWLIEQQAELLYGFIHARYILTEEGLDKMHKKYQNGDFPRCPRVLCNDIKCLPYGVSYDLMDHPVKLFCPNCNDIYNINDEMMETVDGAFFGSSWIHPFLQKYSDIIPNEEPVVYKPRIFGFRLAPDPPPLTEEEDTTT